MRFATREGSEDLFYHGTLSEGLGVRVFRFCASLGGSVVLGPVSGVCSYPTGVVFYLGILWYSILYKE